MAVPLSTYRVQVNRGFPFSEVESLVDYLSSLGVSHLYCSPILKAKSGSVHCYDVTDHSLINPEIGGGEGFERLISRLREAGIGVLLDIVPNHMSTSMENRYWADVLEYGRSSPFARMFDVDWHPPSRDLDGKVLLPVLDRSLAEAVSSGLARLAFPGSSGRPFVVRVGSEEFPLAPSDYGPVLAEMRDGAAQSPTKEYLGGLLSLVPQDWPKGGEAYRAAAEKCKRLLLTRMTRRGSRRLLPAASLRRASLLRLLRRQNYLLAHWREADTRVNYRRFLNVNELVALRVEDRRVFERTHAVVRRLFRERRADGIRVDHADGLRDPALYFRRLRAALRTDADEKPYVLAEKILLPGKRLPPEWEVSGTTGYEFMNDLNRLFVKPGNAERFEEVYREFSGERTSYHDSVRAGKLLTIRSMQAELRSLSRLLAEAYPRRARPAALRAAISLVAADFDGYRVYISPRTRSVRGTWRSRIVRSVGAARKGGADRKALAAVRGALLMEGKDPLPPARRRAALEFVLRFQQFTAAVAVKGEEDTALYRYVRLTSLNEVGGDPTDFGSGVPEFHRGCARRAKVWPHAMLSTSTHDTKRSEDVRARISVLSEVPDAWEAALGRWSGLTARAKTSVGGKPVPTRNDEYLFYQTLLGAWPHARRGSRDFTERMVAYMRKASKEERMVTSWTEPDRRYDAGLERFVRKALRGGRENGFLRDFAELETDVDWYGMLNSLSQTLLKLTAPGVPDTYQGNEMWDYSLVDPDNRRPVDFATRIAEISRLDRLTARRGVGAAARASISQPSTGAAKLFLTASVLRFRMGHPTLFSGGAYRPLRAKGRRAENLCSFSRESGRSRCIVCAPRFFTELCAPGELPLGRRAWGDTKILLRAGGGKYTDVLTGAKLEAGRAGGARSLAAGDVFSSFPVALLYSG